MVWLLANEHGVAPIRATDDVDVAVDIRTDQQAIKRLCAWLESHHFDLERPSTDVRRRPRPFLSERTGTEIGWT